MTQIFWVECGGGESVGIDNEAMLIDSEGRHCCEPIGLHVFAWLPVKCRNGKLRWFRTVERHKNGSYTLGRA